MFSVTVAGSVTGKAPATVGVPATVVPSSERPGGRPAAVYVKLPVPPVAGANAARYGEFVTPSGRMGEKLMIASLIVSGSVLAVERFVTVSVAVMITLAVPTVSGIPVMFAPSNTSPPGNPLTVSVVASPFGPAAVTGALYATPMTPLGSEVVVMVGGVVTVPPILL